MLTVIYAECHNKPLMLNVFMLNVVAPLKQTNKEKTVHQCTTFRVTVFREDVRLLCRWISHGGANAGTAAVDETGNVRLQDPIWFENFTFSLKISTFPTEIGPVACGLYYEHIMIVNDDSI